MLARTSCLMTRNGFCYCIDDPAVTQHDNIWPAAVLTRFYINFNPYVHTTVHMHLACVTYLLHVRYIKEIM